MSFTILSFGQKYRTSEIKAKADSILKVYLEDSVFFKFTFYNINSSYQYKNKNGKLISENLTKYKMTKGKFNEAEIRWFLAIPVSNCPEYDTIKGNTSIKFDSLLKPKNKPNFDFIPDFYWEKSKCNLISKDQALSDAKRLYLKTGLGSPQITIKFKTETKEFVWEISQILTIDSDNKRSFEVVELNASSGELIGHHFLQEDTQY